MRGRPSPLEVVRRAARDPVYANGAALVLNAVAGAALGFAFWLVAARLFAPEALGFGAAVVSAATLAALVGKMGFDAAVVRYVPGAKARMAWKILVAATAGTVALTALAAVAVLALASGPLSALSPLLMPQATLGFALLACGTAAAWILDAFFLAEQAAVRTLLRNLAFHAAKLLVLVAVLGALAGFAVPFAWGVGVACSLGLALALVPARLRAKPRAAVAPPPTRGEVAAYAAKNYVLNLSEFLPGLVLPLLVLEAFGPEVNARFYVAWAIASVGFLASKAVAQSAFAALVRDGPPREALAKGGRLSALVLAPFVLVLVAAPGHVLALLGPGYAAAAPVLRVLALSVVPLALWNHYLAYLKARRANWELTALPAFSLLALLAALPLALERAGTMGVALAWLAVQAAGGLYAWIRLHDSLDRCLDVPRTALRRRAHQG